jgi:hypothetical protein
MAIRSCINSDIYDPAGVLSAQVKCEEQGNNNNNFE